MIVDDRTKAITSTIVDQGSQTLRVCVVVCTYRRFDVIPESLDALVVQNYDKDALEIVVVDNSGQPAQSEQIIQRYRHVPNMKYVLEGIPGLSRARNIGWRGTEADIVAYIDDDAVAAPDWVQRIVETYNSFGPEAGVVGGAVHPIWSKPKPSWIHDYMLGFLSIVNWGGETRVTAEREWLAGTNVTFRRELLEKFDGFDENLGRTEAALLSNEEIALVARIKAQGGKTIYNPDASVQHIISPDRLSHEWFRRRAFWQAISDLLMKSEKDLVPEHVWDGVTKYFRKLPASWRTPSGFFANPQDPELFQLQLDSIYSMVRMVGYGLPCPATAILS